MQVTVTAFLDVASRLPQRALGGTDWGTDVYDNSPMADDDDGGADGGNLCLGEGKQRGLQTAVSV